MFFFCSLLFLLKAGQSLVAESGTYRQVLPNIQPALFHTNSVFDCRMSCTENPACMYFSFSNQLCQLYYGASVRILDSPVQGGGISNADIRDCPAISEDNIFNCSLYALDHTCYCITNQNAANLTWSSAMSFCNKYGMKFVSVETLTKFAFVGNLTSSVYPNGTKVWVSAKLQYDPVTNASLGFHKWMSTNERMDQIGMGTWCSREPNFSGPCVYLGRRRPDGGYCWDDTSNKQQYRALCQFQAI